MSRREMNTFFISYTIAIIGGNRRATETNKLQTFSFLSENRPFASQAHIDLL